MSSKAKVNKTTEFSRCISKYVADSGYTVYKISQITGLGRTAIQHIMSGNLVPTQAFLDKLCTVFKITPRQKDALTELYFKEKFGEKTYNERKNIRSIIETLPQYYVSKSAAIIPDAMQLPDTKSVSGFLNINQMISEIIGKELEMNDPLILTTIPFENKMLYDNIVQMFGACDNKNAVVEHFFRIYKNDSGSSVNNTETLKNALTMAMNVGMVYNPYCYYAYKEAVDDCLPIFPYSLISSAYVVLVSGDFQLAVISNDSGIMKTARTHIDKIKRSSKLMIEMIDNKRMFDIFAESSRFFDKSLEYQPCVSKYITLEIVSKKLIDIPEHDYIFNFLEKNFFTSEQIKVTMRQSALNVFSRRGLENFAETGVMINMPGQLLKPLSVEERIYILECMKNDVGDYFKMLDDSKLRIPQFMQIIHLNNQSCIISCLMKNKKFCCKLTEQSLCSALDDFIGSLCETNYTLDDSELIAAIDRCIEKLKLQIEREDENKTCTQGCGLF